MDILGPIKAHPVLAGGVALVAVVAVVVLRSAGGSVAPTAPASSGVADASAAQSQQQAYNSHAQDVAAGVNVALDTNATNIALAKINAGYQGDLGAEAANIASQQISASLTAHQLDSTLSERVAEAQISSQNTQAAIAAATTQQQYALIEKQSEFQANTTNQLIGAQIEASKPHGFLSWLFG